LEKLTLLEAYITWIVGSCSWKD